MNKSLTWRTILVMLVVAWAAYTLYPLQPVDLIHYFDSHAKNKDAAYQKFMAKVIERTNSVPSAYLNLRETAREEKIALTNYFQGRRFYRPDIKDPNQAILVVLQRGAQGTIKLGLDLIGGNSFLIEMDMTEVQPELRSQAVSEATKILRKRLDKYGVAEPLLQPIGENRILVQMPGLDDASKADVRSTLQRTAHLEFRLVHKDNDSLVAKLDQPGFIPPVGYDRMEIKERRDTGKPDVVFVSKKTVLTGKAVKSAYVAFEAVSSTPYVSMEFNSEGATAFGKITSEHVGDRLAILLDGEIYSAPVIQTAILGGQAQITGRFTLQEAAELANVLENPLAAPVKIVEERSVGASLGQDSIESGIKASIIGTIAVVVFILFYYYFVGLIADFALLLNVLILLAVLATFQATLTLPGIAGIALTIGMAVDANVLIYERVREELLAGKRIAAAIVAGYSKAFSTIIDSNLTTLITSVILIFLGTGPVQGFGVTLTIGICVSMFTALVVTRLLFDYLLSKGKLRTIKMQRWVKETAINFMGMRTWAFGISWALIAVGIVWCGMRYQNHTLLGVDFAGGDSVMLSFEKSAGIAEVRNALEGAGLKDVFIQYQRDAAGVTEHLNVKTEFDAGKEVEPALRKAFPDAGFTQVGLDKVQPVVGKEILWSAMIAIFWALVGILFYVAVRFEFPFAVGAVIAIIHDVLMTVAWFGLTGRQVSATFIAAILTIIGYSINDTIVVFDRVREDLRLGKHGTLAEIMNRAINETLSRTMLTGGTVFLATFALYLFGGGAINDFAFCFLVGILTGTYSSIFIASPIVLWWNKGKKVEVGVKPKPAVEGEATT
jgi:SecD/SecF fusion protein